MTFCVHLMKQSLCYSISCVICKCCLIKLTSKCGYCWTQFFNSTVILPQLKCGQVMFYFTSPTVSYWCVSVNPKQPNLVLVIGTVFTEYTSNYFTPNKCWYERVLNRPCRSVEYEKQWNLSSGKHFNIVKGFKNKLISTWYIDDLSIHIAFCHLSSHWDFNTSLENIPLELKN